MFDDPTLMETIITYIIILVVGGLWLMFRS
jgi:hypothetical protein